MLLSLKHPADQRILKVFGWRSDKKMYPLRYVNNTVSAVTYLRDDIRKGLSYEETSPAEEVDSSDPAATRFSRYIANDGREQEVRKHTACIRNIFLLAGSTRKAPSRMRHFLVGVPTNLVEISSRFDKEWVSEIFDKIYLGPTQKVNHFRNHYQLTRKDMLVPVTSRHAIVDSQQAKNLNRAREKASVRSEDCDETWKVLLDGCILETYVHCTACWAA
ncbi:hypothetical protein FOL47_007718 [Perkinsus chesapeaki]|uniref:Uncharacterized protein n=1 Tax=Perkinsus chesapeaki TaxID=330153 RepID=A0A7J6LIH9_PERCH|nr:hypothetical protein FOL47_007718 [Perkinsus chesapeaki]